MSVYLSTRVVRVIIGTVAMGTLLVPAFSESAAAAGRSAPVAPIPAFQVDPGHQAPTPNFRQPLATTGSSATDYFYNWSGYAAQAGSPFTDVTTTYTQPAVTCPVANAFTVFWVGFDGFTNDTVEQDGTLAYCNGTTPEYQSWWEMYPTNDINPVFTVTPGDKITATVTYKKGVYVMTVKDKTNGQHFREKQTCAADLTCSRDSAEWIVERPGYGGFNYAPLADWGTVNVPGDKASDGGRKEPISSFSSTAIDMVNLADSYYLAQVGGLNTAGNSFPDTWDNSQ